MFSLPVSSCSTKLTTREGQRWQPEHTQPLAPLSRHPKLQLPPVSWIFSCKKKDFSQCLLKVSTEWSISPKWCSMNVNGTCDCQWEALHTGSQWRKDKAPCWWSIWFYSCWWSSCLFVGLFVFIICFYLRLGLFISFVCLFVSSFTYEMFLWISVAWNESWHSATSWKQITKEVTPDGFYGIKCKYSPHALFQDRPISLFRVSNIVWWNITNRGTLSLSDPCAHGVRSLMYETM